MKATELWNIQPMANPEAVFAGKDYRITVLTDCLLRLEYEENGRFRDSATQMALCRRFPVPAMKVHDGEELVIETDCVRLRYDKKPFSATGLTVTLKGQYGPYVSIWQYGSATGRNLGGTARTLDEVDGETPLEDGLMAMLGYSVIDDSRTMDMDNEGHLRPATGKGIDLYLFAYGHDFKGCLRDFLTLSGKAPTVPRKALGNWWSRFYSYTEQSYMELMERFRKEGVPLSVSVLDMNWHTTRIDPKYGTGWTGYTWDKECFPDPERMMNWLHEHGLIVTVNDHPADGIRACEELYEQMAKEMGVDPQTEEPFPYDAADEKFQKAFEKVVLDGIEKQGVDFWWIDWQQQGGTSEPSMNPLFVLNHTRYVHAIESGKPAMTLSRYGGPGSQRYPLGFSGDSFATWDSLRFQPYFTSTAANIAYGWWSHDIGGHMHGTKDDELAVRWLQYGVFSPIMRLHSTMNPFMRKEPWLYPMEKAEIMRKFLRLRHRMVPWLYTQNVLASRNQTALLRPMYYDYPGDWALYRGYKTQYMLGDCMMLSPIVEPMDKATGLSGADTYLPEGEWTDMMTGLRYQGGRTLTMYRRLDQTPVLLKAGSILPMDGADVPENGVPLPATILWRITPNANGQTELIEDNDCLPEDGRYLSAVTRASLSVQKGLTVRIEKPEGETSLLPVDRRHVVELIGVANILPDEADCAYTASYDAQRRALRIALEKDSAVLHWNARPEAPQLDWRERVVELMKPSEIPYDQQHMIGQAAMDAENPTAFLAQVHSLHLPDSLFGAMLELLSAQ